MKLGEFIKNFSHNNIVRLHYKIKGGNQLVLEDWNDVSMDHEIVNGKGKVGTAGGYIWKYKTKKNE